MEKRIFDKRRKNFFMMDDEYLNGMAKLVGHQGTLVYISLCRHADKNQECFPSIKLISEEHNISIDTVKRGIKSLKEKNIIDVEKKRTKNGKWFNNSYTLLDKSVWNYSQSANSTVASQSAKLNKPECKIGISQSANSTTKETHIEGNTYKETQRKNVVYKEILMWFNALKDGNFANINNPKGLLDFLINKYGLDKVNKAFQKHRQDYNNPYQHFQDELQPAAENVDK